MCVPREPNVDPVVVPELIERGVEVEVNPAPDRLRQARIAKHAADVDEDVGALGELANLPIFGAHRLISAPEQQRGSVL